MSQNRGNQPNTSKGKSSFRTVPVQQRSIGESWAVLPARTRLYISLGITCFALAGIFVSDKLEDTLPPPPEPSRVPKGATKEVPPP